jgi:hypothetical protein
MRLRGVVGVDPDQWRRRRSAPFGRMLLVGVGGVKIQLTPLFQGQRADGPFETVGFLVKADPP